MVTVILKLLGYCVKLKVTPCRDFMFLPLVSSMIKLFICGNSRIKKFGRRKLNNIVFLEYRQYISSLLVKKGDS